MPRADGGRDWSDVSTAVNASDCRKTSELVGRHKEKEILGLQRGGYTGPVSYLVSDSSLQNKENTFLLFGRLSSLHICDTRQGLHPTGLYTRGSCPTSRHRKELRVMAEKRLGSLGWRNL